MTDYALGFPGKYVQGPGAIDRIGTLAAKLGKQPLVMADAFVLGLVGSRVADSLAVSGLRYNIEQFGGECSRPEFTRIAEKGRSLGSDLVIAVGGGKTLDAGKAAAAELSVDVISVPTIASTDGPVSSIAVEYTEDHVHIGVIRFNRSPSAVLVDSQIIANAPARLLAAGMGDALATWYEARACAKKGVLNFQDGSISSVGMTLARMCHDTILEFGQKAYKSVDRNEVNDAVERVIEANVFLSGVGFENTGVAGAHALDGALSRFTSIHDSQHGERVALGVLLQLTLEGAPDEIETLLPFYKSVGLPCSLADLGLNDLEGSGIGKLADLVLRDGSPIRNLPFDVDRAMVNSALESLTGPKVV